MSVPTLNLCNLLFIYNKCTRKNSNSQRATIAAFCHSILCLCVRKISINMDTSKQRPSLTSEESSIDKTKKPQILEFNKGKVIKTNSNHSCRYSMILACSDHFFLTLISLETLLNISGA